MTWRKEQKGSSSKGLPPSRDAGGLPGSGADDPGGNGPRPGAPDTPLPNGQAAPEPPPGFLELLDSDPAEAFSQFYAFCWKALRASPPPFLERIPLDQRKNAISDTISHCWENDKRVLRTFESRGARFSTWLYTTANRRAWNYWRDVIRPESPITKEIDELIEETVAGVEPSEADLHEFDGLIQAINRCLARLSELCRTLLVGTAEGRSPSELAQELGYPPGAGKRVWNRLRACRERLSQILKEQGVDWRSYGTGGQAPYRLPVTGVSLD